MQDPVTWLGPMYEEDIVFSDNKNTILLTNGPIYYNMQQLENFLQKTLINNLKLDKSISSDIGYLCNEYSYNESGFTLHTFPSGYVGWIGYQYHTWEAASNDTRYITWLYNDSCGNIIFEITPFYPYMYCEPEEEPNYIPYHEWIKTYKPYLTTILPIEIAQQWLDQAQYIIKNIQNNEETWQKTKIY